MLSIHRTKAIEADEVLNELANKKRLVDFAL